MDEEVKQTKEQPGPAGPGEKASFVFPDLARNDVDAEYLLRRGFQKTDWRSYSKPMRLRAERNVFSEVFRDIGTVPVYFDLKTGSWTAEFWPAGCLYSGELPARSEGNATAEQALAGVADAVMEAFRKEIDKQSLADWECTIV